MNKKLGSGLAVLCAMFLIPFLVTMFTYNDDQEGESRFTSGIYVYVNEGDRTETLDFDEYLVGVVAAQIPGDYEMEAIKAQAVAARTYAMGIIGERTRVDSSELNQSYKTVSGMKDMYGSQYDEYYEKLVTAVVETTEEVILYEDTPISAVFFRCSNGKTRNAEDVWGSEISYLVSVESEWDQNSESYKKQVTYTLEECIEKVSVSYREFQASPLGLGDTIQITEKDSAGYVKQIQFGNMTFTGEELRYVLDLDSSCFEVKVKSDSLIFTTYGVGHGVGMSQYGANEMAKEGSGYEAILKYYYQGTKIQ